MFVKVAMVASYVLVIIVLSFLARTKTNKVDDFVLGGRSVGPWMSAFAFGTTYFSAVLLIGFAGKVGWGFGLGALWIALGNAFIGTYLAWKILGPRTREMTSRLNVLTMPSFLEVRYDSPYMKIVSSLIIFIFFVPYTASVFMGLSYLFEKIFAIPYVAALLIMTILAGLYLVLGGYLAVALMDFVQGIIMIGGIILMVHYVNGEQVVGGFSQAYHSLQAMNPEYISPGTLNGWVGLISTVILTSLGTWGLPQMVQKFYSIKNREVIPKATIVSTLFSLLITGGAYYVGSTGHLFFDKLPALDGKPTPDLIMPTIISQSLPEIVAVLILILVLSASMSTLTSLVLVASSSVSIDLVKGTLKPDLSEKSTVLLMRILCIVFLACSLFIALKPPAIMVTLMSLSWGTVAGAFLAPYIYGLFWKKTTKIGAWSGMIVGAAISIGGYFLLSLQPAFISPEIMQNLNAWGSPFISSIAILVPLLVVPAVSCLTSEFSAEHIKEVYAAEQ